MENNNTQDPIYTLDLSYIDIKDSRVQIIKTALPSWQEKYGEDYISFIETEVSIGKIFKNHSAKNISMKIKSEDIFSQICGVVGIKFEKSKLNYNKDLF